jgi:hypothetical protein
VHSRASVRDREKFRGRAASRRRGLEYLFVVGLQRDEQLDRLFADPQPMQEPVPEVADGDRGDDVPELVLARMLR